MTAVRVAAAAVLIVAAVVLQTALVARLPLGAGRPDLLLVVVVALALAAGPAAGVVAGFGAGLLADLLADHPAGLLALVLCVTGYAAGRLGRPTAGPAAPPRRPAWSVVRRLAVVAAAGVAYPVVVTLALAVAGRAPLDWRALGASLPGSATGDVILAVLVVPAVGFFLRSRREEPDRVHRR